MRIVMMGTGPFAVPTFRWLLESTHDVPLLVTRPPRSGRGKKKPPPNPMQLAAEAVGLPVAFPESINEPDALSLLESLAADLFVVCDYGQILSAQALGLAKRGGINLHGSLLPLYRGAAPVNWALYDGQTETGVTVIHMTPRLDAGPSLVQKTVAIGPHETAVELEERLAQLGVPAVEYAIEQLAAGDGSSELGQPQDRRQATRAPRLKRQDGLVAWQRSAVQIANQVRAFQPWPGTFSHWMRSDAEPLRVILDKVEAVTATLAAATEPGTVLQTDDSFLIATGEGALRIQSIQPAGRKLQPWDAFLRGYRVAVGDKFGS